MVQPLNINHATLPYEAEKVNNSIKEEFTVIIICSPKNTIINRYAIVKIFSVSHKLSQNYDCYC